MSARLGTVIGLKMANIFYAVIRGGRVMAGLVPLVVALTALAGGCGPPRTPYPRALLSERPDERAAAVKQAAESNDQSVIGILVERLEDEDETVRFYAILALEKMTGQRYGYNYYDGQSQRQRAVQRWRRYLSQPPRASSREADL